MSRRPAGSSFPAKITFTWTAKNKWFYKKSNVDNYMKEQGRKPPKYPGNPFKEPATEPRLRPSYLQTVLRMMPQEDEEEQEDAATTETSSQKLTPDEEDDEGQEEPDDFSDYDDNIMTADDLKAEAAGLMAEEGPVESIDDEAEEAVERAVKLFLPHMSAGKAALSQLDHTLARLYLDNKHTANWTDEDWLKKGDLIPETDHGGYFRVQLTGVTRKAANCTVYPGSDAAGKEFIFDKNGHKYVKLSNEIPIYSKKDFGFPKRHPNGDLMQYTLPDRLMRVKCVHQSRKKTAETKAQAKQIAELEESDEDWADA